MARDEYHERTASRDIKFVMPKQLTKQNMEVITQYSTYGARVRNNFLHEFFSIRSSPFELAKGCSRKWLVNQERLINIFLEMLRLESPFKIEGRLLHQPYTHIPAKLSLKKEFLGRENFGDTPQDHGREILLSYVSPLFCNVCHVIATEKQAMKKRCMLLFPKPKSKSQTRKTNQMKDRDDIAQVLAASIVKLSTNPENSQECKINGCQVSEIPGVIAETEYDQFRQKTKTGIRTCLENRYEIPFRLPHLQPDNVVYIKDGMQDLFMRPLLDQVYFGQYFTMWWDNKVRRCFALGKVVVLDFDKQIHTVLRPKGSLQIIRDNETGLLSSAIAVTDDGVIPSGKKEWESFLANRSNKASLVHYLCEKMKESSDKLHDDEMLVVSYEGNVFKVLRGSVTHISYLDNNHNESDTRVFFLLSHLQLEQKTWVIRSTNTDMLFTVLINYDKLSLDDKHVYIHCNNIGQGQKYCFLNELITSIENDPQFSLLKAKSVQVAKLVGLLHFITGCNDLSFLRGFSKYFCFGAFVHLNDLICDSAQKVELVLSRDSTALFKFMVNFLSCIYAYKFANSFNVAELSAALSDLSTAVLLDDIRKRTWHQTIYLNNTLPSLTAIELHSKRFGYVLSSFANATEAYHILPDPTESGWIRLEINGSHQLVPEWVSAENRKAVDVMRKTLLKKCRCKKTACKNKHCTCRKAGNRCTTLCNCIACKNVDLPTDTSLQPITEAENHSEDNSMSEEENDDAGDDEDEDMNEEDDEEDKIEEESSTSNLSALEDELDDFDNYDQFQRDMYNMMNKPFLSDHDMNEVEDDGEDDGSGNLFADLV